MQFLSKVVANLPSRLEKNTKHLNILLMTIFYESLKIDNFPNFGNFPKSSAAHTKIVVCILFYVNMFDKTPCNLMSPFSTDIFLLIFLLIWYPFPILT